MSTVVSSPTTEAAAKAAAAAVITGGTLAKTAAKPGPVKKVKKYDVASVEKNQYTQQMAVLEAKGAVVIAVSTSPDVRNTFDVHYYTLG